jgi:hypothetical protein
VNEKGANIETLSRLLGELQVIEESLASEIMDDQTKAEADVSKGIGHYDDYGRDEGDARYGIVYPENASPDLDCARTQIQEAINLMQERIER